MEEKMNQLIEESTNMSLSILTKGIMYGIDVVVNELMKRDTITKDELLIFCTEYVKRLTPAEVKEEPTVTEEVMKDVNDYLQLEEVGLPELPEEDVHF
jgi:hypothetical protein